MASIANNFDKTIDGYLDPIKNEYITAGVSLFLILYAAVIAPKLPPHVIKWFDNWVVQVALFFAIVYISNKNVTVALIAAVAVLITLMVVNNQIIIRDVMEETDDEYDPEYSPEYSPEFRPEYETESMAQVEGFRGCGYGKSDNDDVNEDDDRADLSRHSHYNKHGKSIGKRLPKHMMDITDSIVGLMDEDVEEAHTKNAGMHHSVHGGAHTSVGGPKMHPDMEPDFPNHQRAGEPNESQQDIMQSHNDSKIKGVYQHYMDGSDDFGSSLDDSTLLGSDHASVNHVDKINKKSSN